MLRLLALALLALVPAVAQKYSGGLWVEVSKETVPAGGTAQLQVFLTEPKPIIRTKLELVFDPQQVEQILSVSVYGESGDAVGTATRRWNRLIIQAASPSAEIGWGEEYPMFTVDVRLRSGARPGDFVQFDVAPESEFYRQDGSPWTVDRYFTGGISVGGELSIDSVQPSGGIIRAGQVVRILGKGFREDTHIEIPKVEGLHYRYLSPTEMELWADREFLLEQREILIHLEGDHEKEIYTSLLGVDYLPSAWDTVSSAIPMFSHRMDLAAAFRLPEPAGADSRFAALALQNPQESPAQVRIYLVSPDGASLGHAYVTLLPGERFSRDLTELISVREAPAGSEVRVRSSVPIQVIGLSGDHNTAEIKPVPLLPREDSKPGAPW